MNQLILNNMSLFSALAVCAAITFIAYVLHRSAQPQEKGLIYQDFNDLMDRIESADCYDHIRNLETEIDDFDYHHNHEVECGRMLMKLNDAYNEKRHAILVDLSLQVN